jgi:hypothetical protein
LKGRGAAGKRWRAIAQLFIVRRRFAASQGADRCHGVAGAVFYTLFDLAQLCTENGAGVSLNCRMFV